MAVVLPIHSQLDFSNPTENDFESRCQNEETEEDESSSAMSTNRESENESSDNGDCQSPDASDEKEEQVKADEKGNNGMEIGDSSDDCNEQTETLPLSVTTQVVDSTTDEGKTEEDQTANTSVDNYWVMENENTDESPETGISSLTAVDLASNNQATNDGSTDEPVSDLVEAIVMDRGTDEQEDDMELDGAHTPIATPIDESSAAIEVNDDDNVDTDFPPVTAEAMEEVEIPETPSYGGLRPILWRGR